MLCEKVLGNLKDDKFKNLSYDYVDIEWYEAFKKLHKKTTYSGEEIGIRLDNDILKTGLKQDDVLYADSQKVVVVNIPVCEVIVAEVEDYSLIPKLCYEIGNRHATLFYGDNNLQFITPYNEPMLEMINKIHKHIGNNCYRVNAVKKVMKLDFNKAISSSINNHTH
ncbi:MAG: urease accessory protein UreE [Lachnospirales bacterium]